MTFFGISIALLATQAVAFVTGGLTGWIAKAKAAVAKVESDVTTAASNVKKDL